MSEYSKQEIRELKKDFRIYKQRAVRLINNEKFDYVTVYENELNILTQFTCAETYQDVNPIAWRLIDLTLNNIRHRFNKVKFEYKDE